MDVIFLMKERASSGSDWPIILTAIGAILSPFVAFAAIWFQGRRMRFQLGLENLWQLVRQWDDRNFQVQRSDAAKHALENFGQLKDPVPKAVIDVLDTFEFLGFLVLKSKTLRLKHAWAILSLPAIYWWYACHSVVKEYQKTDPTLYEDYEKLVNKFIKHEARRRGVSREELEPTDPVLVRFLEGEFELV